MALLLFGLTPVGGADGAPLMRFYPFEEIGSFSRGVQLAHDRHGRLIVAQQGECVVLNDTQWQTVWRENPSGLNIRRIAQAADGSLLFGAFGSWGKMEPGQDGELRPRSLVPADAPQWVHGSIFDQIRCTDRGVFFSGLGGVVYWDMGTGRHQYFEIKSNARLYRLHGRTLVSTFDNGTLSLDVERGTMSPSAATEEVPSYVYDAAGDGERSLLLAAVGELHLLRKGRFERIVVGPDRPMRLTVSAMVALPEGGFAVALSGWGGAILDGDGRVRATFSGPEFTGITTLEAHETGVLWAAGEGGLFKILYGQPLTSVLRTSGLPINWPQIAQWNERLVMASGGGVYSLEPTIGFTPLPTALRERQEGPPLAIWGIAVVGKSLLVSGGDSVFCVDRDRGPVRILSDLRVARLVALDPDTCLVVGAEKIAALRRGPDGWSECAPRATGVGYPYIVHEGGRGSAWLELGLDRAARVAVEGDQLVVRLVKDFPWQVPNWVNISIVGEIAVLCGSGSAVALLDERTLAPVEDAALRRLFAESPHWIQRLSPYDHGRYWASYDRGLMLVTAEGEHWRFDDRTYAGVNGPAPKVTALPRGDTWASTGNSLFRLQAPETALLGEARGPVLLTMRNGRTHELIASVGDGTGELGRLPFSANSLQLDFFAGTYAAVRPFSYEFRLNNEQWRRVSTGSPVLLSDLSAGRYDLAVRTAGTDATPRVVSHFRLEIAPPWYRRWFAYFGYAALAIGLVSGISRLSARRVRRRQAALELDVAERTRELRMAMERLQEETQVSATLAERNRLAAEIHDSLEQGFAGLALQLETTAGLPGCPGPVQAGVTAALNMVNYCRKEIRHAVQGLHSPVLGTADLTAAVRQLAEQLSPISEFATVRVLGPSRQLPSATEHHLLRIVQEAVANTVKHATAKRLEVVLAYEADGVRLEVTDDGRGFRPEDFIQGTGRNFGLPGLRARAAKFGGSVEINSRPGGGTTIRVWAPVPSSGRTKTT